MTNKLVLTLNQPEYSALLDLSVREMRRPEDQVRYILKAALEQSQSSDNKEKVQQAKQ